MRYDKNNNKTWNIHFCPHERPPDQNNHRLVKTYLNIFFKCIAEWTQNEAEETKAEAKVGILQGGWTPKLAFTLRGSAKSMRP